MIFSQYTTNIFISSSHHTLFIKNTFISKLAKNHANAYQHPETEVLQFEDHILHWCDHPKIVGHIPRNKQKIKCVCIHEIMRLIITKMKMKIKTRPHDGYFIYLFSIYLSLTNLISPYNQTSLPQTARLDSNIRCDQQHCGMLLSLTPDIWDRTSVCGAN